MWYLFFHDSHSFRDVVDDELCSLFNRLQRFLLAFLNRFDVVLKIDSHACFDVMRNSLKSWMRGWGSRSLVSPEYTAFRW